MTTHETCMYFARFAREKASLIAEKPTSFFLGAMFAGAYVGIGIILIFSVGQGVDPSWRPFVMGISFAIALILVVLAGAELFTGYAMYMTIGRLAGTVDLVEVAKAWLMSWSGNLAGAVVLSGLFVAGGGGHILKPGAELLFEIASHKIHSAPVELICRGMLCNWLVCLSVWMAARTKSDTAKCIVIFWCLFAFIASGFEHSIANMTVFSIALMSKHPDSITISGAFYNLFWVTIGNTVSGAGAVAAGYWSISSSGPKELVGVATPLPHPGGSGD
ncbi:MAG: formate/nitrite transporter family protein [Xanthobacteraceae bacterium]|nr:formate/nitrite transporter family protein [Xanthobacteraceae bacterium]